MSDFNERFMYEFELQKKLNGVKYTTVITPTLEETKSGKRWHTYEVIYKEKTIFSSRAILLKNSKGAEYYAILRDPTDTLTEQKVVLSAEAQDEVVANLKF